mmetsp:Transcript_19097/g.60074  ORF Transcript_19097/g.60074 Transcript_19097/m.60074 type:complete len:219 (+) Transcript_19097:265-921(+)
MPSMRSSPKLRKLCWSFWTCFSSSDVRSSLASEVSPLVGRLALPSSCDSAFRSCWMGSRRSFTVWAISSTLMRLITCDLVRSRAGASASSSGIDIATSPLWSASWKTEAASVVSVPMSASAASVALGVAASSARPASCRSSRLSWTTRELNSTACPSPAALKSLERTACTARASSAAALSRSLEATAGSWRPRAESSRSPQYFSRRASASSAPRRPKQ